MLILGGFQQVRKPPLTLVVQDLLQKGTTKVGNAGAEAGLCLAVDGVAAKTQSQ
jgi:hypothetical protein